MTTREKAKFIQTVDQVNQKTTDEESRRFDKYLQSVYGNAEGNREGWLGIADKEPSTINAVYPVVLAFANKRGLTLET